ncbi:hypothetical protein EJB05_18922, partial [Eragrostis curvula]
MAASQQPRRPPRHPPPPPAANGTSSEPTSPVKDALVEERTVKKLRLTKPLRLSEATAVSEVCRMMADWRVDAALLTDTNGVLSGIVTTEDIAARVIAEGLKPEETGAVKVMTWNPVFVMSNTSATEALQKMVQGKFRHLPIVERGQVIAMLDIAKFLYDAISRMEKAAEEGSAIIAAAMEGVDRSEPHEFMEFLREHKFKPSLSTIITENSRPGNSSRHKDEGTPNSVVVMTGTMLQGIITSKDLVLRLLAQKLSPEITPVDKAMTVHPDCATLDTSILEALHSMQDGKFLHFPVIDKSKWTNCCLFGCSSIDPCSHFDGSRAIDEEDTMIQIFWNLALSMQHGDDIDARLFDESRMVAPNDPKGEHVKPPHINSSLCYKIEDKRGRVHRLSCVSESLDELVSAVAYRLRMENEKRNIELLYDDEEGDRVLLANDMDLMAAIEHAKSVGRKILRLLMDGSDTRRESTGSPVHSSPEQRSRPSLMFGIAAGAAALTGIG